MKYLMEDYWNKINLDPINNKGFCFENLVKRLLIAEYGKSVFQGTKESWDGSKDFYYYSKENNYWAECKNYSSNIDLKVLASTLIMAQLSEIDTILYYSYSSINTNTKAKLLLNANKNGKIIYFYDDIVLEQKIFKYWEFVGKDFFPQYKYINRKIIESDEHFETKCLIFGNPLNLETSINGYEIRHLSIFKMFEMDICVINRENKNKRFSLEFKKYTQVKTQFDIFPEHTFKEKTEMILAPYEGKVIRLWLIPVKENCTIPHPYIDGEKLNLPSNIAFKVLESRNIRRLIGKSYEECIAKFKQNVLYDIFKLKIGIFYGHSGTGKSKLFQECLKISKINGYEIVDFEVLDNSTHIMSIQDFVKRLIIAIYNISLDILEEIIKILNFQKSDNLNIKIEPEYTMLEELFNVTNDKDMKSWIKKYLDLIILKLAKGKYLIAIDNVQFFNDTIIELVDRICIKLYGIKQCETKFLFTFNTDYIKQDSIVSLFLSKYSTDISLAYAEHITGFKSLEECYEFLQETFSIGEMISKNDIDQLAKNLNRNPFYLEQMIYWLQEKEALEQNNNIYRIKNEILFKKLIRNIPSTIYDILLERWKYCEKIFRFDTNKIIILFSAIHLYVKLPKEYIDELKISWKNIKELEKMGFLTVEDSQGPINIMFCHDLVDEFFSKMYPALSQKIIEYENETKIIFRNNATRYYFEILYNKEKESLLSNTLFSEILSLQIDNRLSYEFYLLVFEKFIDNFNYNYSQDNVMALNNLSNIIMLIHDILGNNVMQKCVDKFFLVFKNVRDLMNYEEYGRLLLYISEAYDSMGKYKEAVQLIRNYKEMAFANKDKKLLSIQQQKLLSVIYNRLHVYYRHQITVPLESDEVMEYLDKSVIIADQIQDSVMQYVNYSDRGYLYYDLPVSDEKHKKTLYYWKKACNIYESGNAKEKYINYLRKKTQIALLESESEKAIQAAQKGIDEIDISSYAYQQTFFKWWFYHALAEAYLLCYSSENIDVIERALERALFYSELLESNKKFYYLQLKSVFMFYRGHNDIAIRLNCEAKDLLLSSNYRSKLSSLKNQLIQNGAVFDSTKKKPINNLSSQIQTTDGMFNLPCM